MVLRTPIEELAEKYPHRTLDLIHQSKRTNHRTCMFQTFLVESLQINFTLSRLLRPFYCVKGSDEIPYPASNLIKADNLHDIHII
jgi:hypothetical protein